MSESFPERLNQHFDDYPYRPETVEALGRMCRVGRMSEETCLEVLETLAADRLATELEPRGLEATGWIRFMEDR